MGSPAVDLTDAPRQLRELVEETTRTGEVVLTREGEAVAKIVPLYRDGVDLTVAPAGE